MEWILRNSKDKDKFTFLDLASFTKDGIQDTLEEILATIRTTKTKRVVLDSFSAISLAFEDKAKRGPQSKCF